jgi:hypothetical protein
MTVEQGNGPGSDVRVVGDKLVEFPSSQSDGHAILVRSPKGQTALLQHGTARVSVQGGNLTVVLHEGKAMTGASGALTSLPEAHGQSFGCAGGTIRPLLPAPEFRAGERVWLSTGSELAQPRSLEWTAVPSAAGYQVRITRTDEAGLAQELRASGTTLEEAPALPPGKYDVTVQPTDECGIAGRISEAAQLRVLGLSLPEGAFVDDTGVVRTFVGTSVRLTHSEGLLLGYPGVDAWVPFRSELQLRHDQAMQFMLRSEDSVPTTLRLAPRDIEASVVIGPKNVRWPNQKVDLVVRLQRKDGGAAPDWVEPKVNVTVGTLPLAVAWTRQGDEMRGTVPSQPGEGPCVVRVEVVDQFGVMLGRNFLEVARGPG